MTEISCWGVHAVTVFADTAPFFNDRASHQDNRPSCARENEAERAGGRIDAKTSI